MNAGTLGFMLFVVGVLGTLVFMFPKPDEVEDES